jgi:hypothetical protein
MYLMIHNRSVVVEIVKSQVPIIGNAEERLTAILPVIEFVDERIARHTSRVPDMMV